MKTTKTKTNLFEEALADAKTIKSVALANAKQALEETFNPALRERFAAKLEEMDAEDDIMETEDLTLENEVETTDEELNLEALLAELDGETGKDTMEENSEIVAESEELDEAKDEDADDEKKDDKDKKDDKPKSDAKPKAKAEPKKDAPKAKKEEDDEEVSIEDMSEEDLTSYIQDVVKGMVATGELENAEAGLDGAGTPVGEPEMSMAGENDDDVEVNLDELELEEYGNEHPIAVDDALEMSDVTKEEMFETKKQLAEAHKVIHRIKKDLQEVNLFNAKLLYSNKILKTKNNLTESQKIKILNSFDKTTSVKEVKLVYETLMEGLKTKKSNIQESTIRGLASKTISSIGTKKPILESNDQFARWQKLAGIK